MEVRHKTELLYVSMDNEGSLVKENFYLTLLTPLIVTNDDTCF